MFFFLSNSLDSLNLVNVILYDVKSKYFITKLMCNVEGTSFFPYICCVNLWLVFVSLCTYPLSYLILGMIAFASTLLNTQYCSFSSN